MQYATRRHKDMKEQKEVFMYDLLQHLVMSNTKYSVGFQVHTADTMKIMVFCFVTLSSSEKV